MVIEFPDLCINTCNIEENRKKIQELIALCKRLTNEYEDLLKDNENICDHQFRSYIHGHECSRCGKDIDKIYKKLPSASLLISERLRKVIDNQIWEFWEISPKYGDVLEEVQRLFVYPDTLTLAANRAAQLSLRPGTSKHLFSAFLENLEDIVSLFPNHNIYGIRLIACYHYSCFSLKVCSSCKLDALA